MSKGNNFPEINPIRTNIPAEDVLEATKFTQYENEGSPKRGRRVVRVIRRSHSRAKAPKEKLEAIGSTSVCDQKTGESPQQVSIQIQRVDYNESKPIAAT